MWVPPGELVASLGPRPTCARSSMVSEVTQGSDCPQVTNDPRPARPRPPAGSAHGTPRAAELTCAPRQPLPGPAQTLQTPRWWEVGPAAPGLRSSPPALWGPGALLLPWPPQPLASCECQARDKPLGPTGWLRTQDSCFHLQTPVSPDDGGHAPSSSWPPRLVPGRSVCGDKKSISTATHSGSPPPSYVHVH